MRKQRKRTEFQEEREQLQSTAVAFQRSRILLTAVELDLFTAVGEGEKTAGEVAAVAGTDPRATDRLMNALCALGLLKKSNGRYWNTPHASRFLVRGSPEYMANLAHFGNMWETWSTLTEAVKTGRTVLVRDLAGQDVGWFKSFIAAMHYRALERADRIVSGLDLSGIRRVLDLGGGSGVYAMAFARAGEGMEVVVFDLPAVVPLTEGYVRDAGLGDRIGIVAGDFRKDPLGGDYDLIFVSAIVHANSPDENRALVAKCSEALNPGGRIVIQDFIMSEDRTRPVHGAVFALNMLVGTARGDTYTESEVRGWFDAAGIARVVRYETPFGTTQMIGWK